MKKIKICLSFFFLLLIVTGCDAEYHLRFEDGKIEEHIEWKTDKLVEISDVDGIPVDIRETVYYAYDEIDARSIYSKKINKEGNDYKIELDYAHDPSRFNEAIAFKYFKYHTFIESDNSYYIKTKGGLLKGMEDRIDGTIHIKIDTKNRVIQNNADEVKGSTYIWNITKYNAPTKEILFQVSKTDKEIVKKDGNLVLTALVVIVLIVILPILLWNFGQKLFDKFIHRDKT